MSGIARRDPWPADIKLNGQYYLLARDKKGKLLVSSRPPVFQAQPTSFEYSSQNPVVETTQSYPNLAYGFGLGHQQSRQDSRYKQAYNLDLSIAGKMFVAQLFTTGINWGGAHNETWRKFFELGGNLYIAGAQKIRKRTSDTSWDEQLDLGAAKATDVIVFQHAGGTEYAYLAQGDGANDFIYRSSDGTTWTEHTTLQALFFARTGRELWRAHATNKLSKCDIDADPWTAGNWGADNAFEIGTDQSAITGLAVSATGQLIVFKTDGIYSLNPDGTDRRYFPFLEFAKNANNGRYWGQFENDLYVSYGDSFFRLTPDLTLDPVTPSLQGVGSNAIKGSVTAFVGHGVFNAYGAVYDQDNDKAYVMKYGAWLPPELAGDTEAKRIPVWNGALVENSGTPITAMHVSSIGAATNHQRLYLGISDASSGSATIAYTTLPCVYDPTRCDEMRWGTSADGYVDLPDWDGTFDVDQKALRAATVTITQLPASATVKLTYALTPNTTPATDLTGFNTVPSEKIAFPTGTVTTAASLRLVLTNTSATAPLIVSNLGLLYAIRADVYQQHDLPILCEDNLTKRDGTRMRLDASAIRTAILTPVTGASDYTLILPDERSMQVAVVDYGERTAWGYDHTGRWRKTLLLTVCELAEVA